ncbi:hypothetical protein OJF2_54950 [Aquisphaera giovannonii]|uniref:Uncharacterized protein n=1 Tax=Aquisphaera giovannonii TaxID=406548 RepID=A0A5B9WAK1_9BACT|nr:hypothetical protein OJF2_54950 [Aquisphaera giovannonii]
MRGFESWILGRGRQGTRRDEIGRGVAGLAASCGRIPRLLRVIRASLHLYGLMARLSFATKTRPGLILIPISSSTAGSRGLRPTRRVFRI